MCVEVESAYAVSTSASDVFGPYSLLPAVLAGVFGIGLVETAYADYANEELQEFAKKERQRIDELLRSKEIPHGSYPRFSVAVKGQKVIAFL